MCPEIDILVKSPCRTLKFSLFRSASITSKMNILNVAIQIAFSWESFMTEGTDRFLGAIGNKEKVLELTILRNYITLLGIIDIFLYSRSTHFFTILIHALLLLLQTFFYTRFFSTRRGRLGLPQRLLDLWRNIGFRNNRLVNIVVRHWGFVLVYVSFLFCSTDPTFFWW